jgi:acyl dehydratase
LFGSGSGPSDGRCATSDERIARTPCAEADLQVTSHEQAYGRCLEDFVVGNVFKHWPGLTVTEEEHYLFCRLTLNLNPIHADRWFAAENPQPGRVVIPGPYVFALLSGMSASDVSGSAIATLEVELLSYVAPLYPGDTLYGESQVLKVTPSRTRPDRGVVELQTRGLQQEGKLVCRFDRKLLVWQRAAMPPRPFPSPPIRRDIEESI